MTDIWKKLKRPIVGMAPMDGVTDAAFRRIVARHHRPDITFTEFVTVDGIFACMQGKVSAEKVLDGLIYSEDEHPIIAQVFGASPEKFYAIAPFLCELGFDGIDINMGCPERVIIKSGSGAALIDNPKLAKEIVDALKKGIADWANGKLNIDDFPENMKSYIKKGSESKERKEVPVSVKTRIGTKSNTINEWAKYLAEMDIANVSLHGRTLKQMYEGKADWDAIAEGAKIIKESGASALGNGDIKSVQEGKERAVKYGLDGVLVGRAIMGNPLFFSGREPSAREKLTLALEHAKCYEEILGHKRFVNMRKHLIWYASGFQDASEVRAQLMKASSAKECEDIIMEVVSRF